ncbi:MAG: insulinase family protein [Acidobacteria bacterium]|nr:insulinase family protein [Acidobacteriota bacterium]
MTVDRSRLPEPGPARPFAFPPLRKSTLPNGLRVWSIRHGVVPVVSLMLLVRRGSAVDPAGREGLAAMTADMLDEGSGARSAIDIHEALARIGAQFDTDIGADATLVSLTTLSRAVDRGIELLADMVARPALRDDDFARVRQLRLHRLAQMRDSPPAVAERTFVRLLYGAHPYGHTPAGCERALTSMEAGDVRAFHTSAIRPSVSTLVAVGDCDHLEVERIAATAFDGWTGDDPPAPPDRAAPLPSPARLNIVPRPGAPQSELRIGHVGAARHTPDYHALVVGNIVLGGQFVSRLNLNLRERRGFTYGARTSFDFRRMPGPFSVQVGVQTKATAAAIEESIREIADLRGPRPITSDELALGIAAVTRGYARSFETAEQIARAVVQLALYDLPDDYFAEFVPRIERITADEVTQAMARHTDPARLTVLVVGDLDAVGDDLPALELGDPVVLSADAF